MPTRHCSPTQDAQANRSIQAQRSAPTYLVMSMTGRFVLSELFTRLRTYVS